MNTVRSVGYGWGVLIVAGGGAYYLAKRSINSDKELRKERTRQAEVEQNKLRMLELEHHPHLKDELANSRPSLNRNTNSFPQTQQSKYGSPVAGASTPEDSKVSNKAAAAGRATFASGENAFEPSKEASVDPAPVGHPRKTDPEREGEDDDDKSSYQPKEVFRSIKGDRLTGWGRR